MVIICEGEHSHPPPAPRRVPPDVKEKIINLIKQYGTGEATARRIASSPILPIVLNGKTTLTQEHVALTNQDVLNRIIRKERAKEYPWGGDLHGAVFLMKHQGDGYIRSVQEFDDGTYMVHCQSVEQSKLLMRMKELHCDKTFARTKCQEFEINGWDPSSCRLVTLARLFFPGNTANAYFRAFTAFFDLAEKDTGMRVPFGHLMTDKESATGTRIKAILLDEHGGQIKGLAMYFQSKYPADEDDFHILQIVKTCKVHFNRSIIKLVKSNTDNREHQGNFPLPRVLTISIMFPSQWITERTNCRLFRNGTGVHQRRSSATRKPRGSELAFGQRRQEIMGPKMRQPCNEQNEQRRLE